MTNLTIIPKEPKPESVQHKIGNWYKAIERETEDQFYVLSNVCGKVVLVGTHGNFWDTPQDTYSQGGVIYPNIPQVVFDAVASGSKFKLVENITITEG